MLLRSRHEGNIFISKHVVMPFGAISAVHAWDRIAKLLRTIGRVLLKLPILTYVDDYFGTESEELVEHAKSCFARVVKCLLGDDALSASKLQHGNPLDILGLEFHITPEGIRCKPSCDKVKKWVYTIEEALKSNSLGPGSASKLAGLCCS